MATSTTRKPARPEEVWGMLREASERQKEIDKRWERLEIEAEKDRKEMRKHMKELSNLFRGQWGTFMESLVRGDLLKLLAERGIQIEETHPNIKRSDSNKRVIAEFDIVAANGTEVVVVEVKTTMSSDDVKDFSEILCLSYSYKLAYTLVTVWRNPWQMWNIRQTFITTI